MNGYGTFVGMIMTPDRNLSHCHFVRHKSHMEWPRTESGPPRLEAGDWPVVLFCTGVVVIAADWTATFDAWYRPWNFFVVTCRMAVDSTNLIVL